MRHTDLDRRLVRRAERALAALAVLVAMTVGVLAGQPSGAEPAAEAHAAGTERLGTLSLMLLAEPAPVTARPAAVAASASDRRSTGLVVGFVVLLTCWGLLAVSGAVWRARLATRDRLDWAAGWARVEPGWSGRTV